MDLDWLWEGSAVKPRPRPPKVSPPKSRCRSRKFAARSARSARSEHWDGTETEWTEGSRLARKPWRKTLAEALAAGSQVLSWRGDTSKSMQLANEASRELGHHYRDCVLAKAAHDRRRAAKWARGKGRGEEGAQMGPRNSVIVDAVRKSVTEPGLPLDLGTNLPMEKRFSLQTASARASITRRMSLMKSEERPESKDSARRHSLQLHSMERRKSQQPTKMMKYNRLQRLLAAKQAEFDAIPPHQQERLRTAFNRAREDKPSLNAGQLRQALTEIKLTGRMTHEKEAIQEVIRESVAAGQVDLLDFALQVIPRVEQKLFEAKSPKLLTLFQKLDAVGTGALSSTDCIEALRRHADSFSTILDGDLMDQFWPIYVKELGQMRKISKNSDETVDFILFQTLASELQDKFTYFQTQMEERAAKSANLPPNLEAAHFGEIALMMRFFRRYDPASRGVVSAEQLVLALMDSGTLPVVGRLHHHMMSSYANQACKLIVFRFQDFIEQVHTLRKEENAVREAAFKSWYTIHKWPDDTKIHITDMAQLIMDLSLVADSCRNVSDVRLLVDDVQRDPSESLYMEAAIKLTEKVVETARVQARRREAMVADQVNFSTEQVLSLRSSFSEMTHSGVIGPDDLHDLLTELFPDHEIDDNFVQDLLDAALPSGYFQSGSKPIVRPKREETITKKSAQAQEEEAQAHRRALEESILRFDGFLWIVGHLLKPV